MKHNILLWGWEEQDQISAVNKLSSETECVISLWFTNSNNGTHSYKDFFYRQPSSSTFMYTPSIYKLTDQEIAIFNTLFSRENRSKGEDIHEIRHIAKMYFNKIIELIDKSNIHKALFSIVPVTGFDFLTYTACKRLEIDTIISYQSLQPNLFFIMREIEDFGYFDTINYNNNLTNFSINWGFKKNLFYMNKKVVMNRNRSPIAQLIKGVTRYIFREGSRPMRASGVIQNYQQTKTFRKDYNNISTKLSQDNLPENFVYFPLHLQPELTTNMLGGNYSDQLDAIEDLLKIIPNNWKIICKENPKQGHEERGRNFYNRLLSLKNVIYASKDSNTYMLIENCKFSASITGTVGWESITGLKPTLIFGHAWYRSLPGVVSYREGMTVNEIINTKIDKTKLQKKYNILMSKAHHGIMDSVYTQIYKNYSPQKNVEALYQFLDSFCKNKL